MRGWSAALVLACACGFRPGGGTPGDPDADVDAPGNVIADASNIDAAGVVAWQLHVEADFIDPGVDNANPPAFAGTTLARDLIEPDAFSVGGLLARGSDTNFTSEGASWATVSALPPTGHTSLGLATGNYGAGFPPGVGITGGDTFAMWLEGEIFLEPGSHSFGLDVDAVGFLELDVGPGYRIEDRFDVVSPSILVAVPGADWYPIRIALGEGTSNAWFHVLHGPPPSGAVLAISPHRLRAPMKAGTGVQRLGFARQQLAIATGSTVVDGVPFLDEMYSGAPGDVGIPAGDNYSQRLAGQVWIDAAGAHVFSIASDDGFRMFVDGTVLGDFFDDSTHDVTLPVTLDRGWHDVIVDHQDATSNAYLEVFTGTPPAPIPLADLRPVITGRERIAGGASNVVSSIPGTNTAIVAAPVDSKHVELVVAYDVDHPDWGDLEIRLIAPWGASALIRDNVDQSGPARQVVHVVVPASLLPPDPTAPTAGGWTLQITDTNGGTGGTLHAWSITARFTGGHPAIRLRSSYTSGVHDFGSARAISAIQVPSFHTPSGSQAAIAVRTCDVLPCSGTFEAPSSFPLPPARYAQIQINLVSDGIASPWVDDVDVYVLE